MLDSIVHKEPLISELIDRFIDMLYVTRGLRTEKVEQAFRSVPRHLFVDQYYDGGQGKRSRLIRVDPKRPTVTQLKKIYSDVALVSHRNPPSSTSQSCLVADMLEKLKLKPGMKVLEIGAGTGWNAALMGHLVGPEGQVYSIDIQADVARRARRHIRRQGSRNVTILTGDGGKGYRKGAPYDRVITTVSCPDIPSEWMGQLKEQGMMLITLQDIPGETFCLLLELWKRKDHLRGQVVGLPGFMTLQGKYGVDTLPPKQAENRLERIKAGSRPARKAAPWESWNPGSRQWLRRDLFFFTYLEGLTVDPVGRQRLLGEPVGKQYVLASKETDGVCIADENQVEVYGPDDTYRRFGTAVRKWVELGAPRRDAYRVEIWPRNITKKRPKTGWLVQRNHSQLIFRLK